MPVFKARYRGTCQKCNQPVEPGSYVSWSRRTRGVIYHATCAGETIPSGTPEPTPSGASTPTPTPAPMPETASTMDEGRIRHIAREVADEQDAAMLKDMLAAVDAKLHAVVPTTVQVVLPGESAPACEVPNAHHAMPKLMYLVSRRRHAYLYGPPGSGKSTGAVQAAKALGMRYGYCSLNPQTPESRLLGFVDAGGTYRETEFFKCYTLGGVFCIDEVDNAHPALLNTLNGMLESDADGVGRGAFPCGVVERHPDFVCVGTGNTTGRGADKLFPERRALDAAFLERFTFIAWEYDLALEHAITMAINPAADKWLAWVRDVRTYCRDNAVRLWASPRAAFNGAKMLTDSGWTVEEIAHSVVFKGLDADTVERVLSACPLPQVTA